MPNLNLLNSGAVQILRIIYFYGVFRSRFLNRRFHEYKFEPIHFKLHLLESQNIPYHALVKLIRIIKLMYLMMSRQNREKSAHMLRGISDLMY